MTEQPHREVEHEIAVRAPADEVYRLIADVANWPQIFPPTVYVKHLEHGDQDERIQIWATANGEPKTWISRRELDPKRRRIRFRQERSQPPVASMGGTWLIDATSPAECLVRLRHDYRAVDDDPRKLAWIDQAVDRNSRAELAALKTNAEPATRSADRMLTFDDTLLVDGSAKDVFDFINEAQLWSQRLPHVAKVDLQEATPGLQWLAMDTRAKDGSTHTTTSVRITFPHDQIVYKQVQVPALMTLHTGEWLLTPHDDGVSVTSRHTVVINEANITTVLGADADLDRAKGYVQSALSTNSLATLGYAKRYAEARR
jgi:aromatase